MSGPRFDRRHEVVLVERYRIPVLGPENLLEPLDLLFVVELLGCTFLFILLPLSTLLANSVLLRLNPEGRLWVQGELEALEQVACGT